MKRGAKLEGNLWNEPLILNHNRVKRAYVGGKLLDEWQGIEPASDGQYPEEFLISTVEVTNVDRFPGEGLSRVTLEDGSEKTLKEIIEKNPLETLGAAYAELLDGNLGVLARVGDPKVRHVIQTHPDERIAKNYLGFPYGKDEAWYIINTREIAGQGNYAYAGFKQGVTREKWEDLFTQQDIQGMLDAMHKLDGLKTGDILLIPAGMPHALGPGLLFLEVHEPCDYTFRMERNYLTGRVFTDDEIHYGIGIKKLFDAFHYETYSADEIRRKVIKTPKLIRQTESGQEYELVNYNDTPRFAINKIVANGEFEVSHFDGHRVAIIIAGFGSLRYRGGEKSIRPGQGVLLPAGLHELYIQSDDRIEIIIAYPPRITP